MLASVAQRQDERGDQSDQRSNTDRAGKNAHTNRGGEFLAHRTAVQCASA
jgi:hypothetical protein